MMDSAATVAVRDWGLISDGPQFSDALTVTSLRWKDPVVARRRGVAVTAVTSRYINAAGASHEFARHYARLSKIADPQFILAGSEPPSALARSLALAVIDQLCYKELVPTKIVASAEGGVAICFVRGDDYADIECLNSGVILGVVTNRRDRPDVWEIHQVPGAIAQAAARISRFFEASKADENASRQPFRRQ